MVKYGLAILLVGRLFPGEGGVEDILGSTLPPLVVLTLGLDMSLSLLITSGAY